MMGYVQPEVIKQLNITSQSKSRAEEINRWLDMKEQLMIFHEAQFNENFEEDSINFKTMGEKIQGINESTSQFGKSLLEMAQKL
jgi:protein involved in sex pheromone biosynthesis